MDIQLSFVYEVCLFVKGNIMSKYALMVYESPAPLISYYGVFSALLVTAGSPQQTSRVVIAMEKPCMPSASTSLCTLGQSIVFGYTFH